MASRVGRMIRDPIYIYCSASLPGLLLSRGVQLQLLPAVQTVPEVGTNGITSIHDIVSYFLKNRAHGFSAESRHAPQIATQYS